MNTPENWRVPMGALHLATIENSAEMLAFEQRLDAFEERGKQQLAAGSFERDLFEFQVEGQRRLLNTDRNLTTLFNAMNTLAEQMLVIGERP